MVRVASRSLTATITLSHQFWRTRLGDEDGPVTVRWWEANLSLLLALDCVRLRVRWRLP